MQLFTAIAFMAGLTVSLAGLLVLANRKLYVWEDPRIDDVTDLLPGANCGACGLPGCRAFAEKVVDGNIQPSDCPVGGPDSARFIANYLGIEAGQFEKKVARLQCAGGCDVAVQIAEYEGYPSCRAAAAVTGGFKGCAYGCLGLGDCEDVCDFDAIAMGATGLPVVDAEKCTACGDCVEICPKGLFEMMPVSRHLIVQCKSLLAGDTATALCKVACTGCGICVADAPEGLIEINNGLAVVQSEKWQLQTDIATFRCPTGAIVWIDEQQFAKGQKSLAA
ncbi:MAG: (Fe-S)-binding protein [bacterium]